MGTDQTASVRHQNLDPGPSARLKPAPLAADPSVSEGTPLLTPGCSQWPSEAKQGSQMLMRADSQSPEKHLPLEPPLDL